MATTTTPDFDLDVVSTEKAADILKTSRRQGGGGRSSKYAPIYQSVTDLKKGKFVILRGVDKSAKLGIYQGVRRNFGEEVKMSSAREREASGESYTLVIGRAADYDEMRALARKG